MSDAPRPLGVYIVAGEESGDQLGVKLMRALRVERPGVTFMGVGGPAMSREGLKSLFPLEDIAVMGFLPVVAKLPVLLARIDATAKAVVAARPDVLVIIDSPDFTHRVARRVRRALPDLKIVDYVSPSVWAWRPGRARAMRAYVDHVLALLPFEPEAHLRLGGPPCTYVGHPLVERLTELRPNLEEFAARDATPPTVLVLPGSRRAEIARLLPIFGETIARVSAECGPANYVLPAVDHLVDSIREAVADWPIEPSIVTGEAAKWAAFRRARAALAASGTVTLELALSGIPTVAAYRVGPLEAAFVRAVIQTKTVLLSNLVLGTNAVPEFLQENCTADLLAPALAGLIRGGAARDAQLAELDRLADIMMLEGETPSQRAAKIILEAAGR